MRTIVEQVERLIGLGVPGGEVLEEWAAGRGPDREDALVAIHPGQVPASVLAGLLGLGSKRGFVAPDLTDLDEFVPITGVDVPGPPAYLATDPRRGDELANRSPDEALPVLAAAGRSPMTVNEGISWLLQEPERLERNRCFMTIGSRRPKGTELDRRTPAIWISNGGERDGGPVRRGAPKIGWCWAGNRHSWLGFGSVGRRLP